MYLMNWKLYRCISENSFTKYVFDYIWINFIHDHLCNLCDPSHKKQYKSQQEFFEKCTYLDNLFF